MRRPTLHEVAHAVGAGNAMGADLANVAIIVKMIRVMLLVPVLLILCWWVARRAARSAQHDGSTKRQGGHTLVCRRISSVIGFNSFDLLPNAG